MKNRVDELMASQFFRDFLAKACHDVDKIATDNADLVAMADPKENHPIIGLISLYTMMAFHCGRCAALAAAFTNKEQPALMFEQSAHKILDIMRTGFAHAQAKDFKDGQLSPHFMEQVKATVAKGK